MESNLVKDSELENMEMFENMQRAIYSLAKTLDKDPGNKVAFYSFLSLFKDVFSIQCFEEAEEKCRRKIC